MFITRYLPYWDMGSYGQGSYMLFLITSVIQSKVNYKKILDKRLVKMSKKANVHTLPLSNVI